MREVGKRLSSQKYFAAKENEKEKHLQGVCSKEKTEMLVFVFKDRVYRGFSANALTPQAAEGIVRVPPDIVVALGIVAV